MAPDGRTEGLEGNVTDLLCAYVNGRGYESENLKWGCGETEEAICSLRNILFYVMAISLNHLNFVSEKVVNMFCIKFRTLCCCFHNLPNHSKTEPESESERIYAAHYTMRILQNQC